MNRPKDPLAQELGARGGEVTKNRYGSEYFRKLQKLGVKAKKRKKQYS